MRDESTSSGGARRRPALVAAILCAALAIPWSASVSMSQSLGYDEAMHALAPSLRLLAGAREGEWGTVSDAFFGCEQYPFGYPMLLALVQAFTGPSELACRIVGRVLLALAAFLVFEIARRAVGAAERRGRVAPGRLAAAPWIALALVLLSPLCLAYSGTLFLEVPFLAVAAGAVLAWIARDGASPARAARLEFLAGALAAAALFTKFNYGVLLFLGLGVELLCEGVARLRAGETRAWLASAGRAALAPSLVCLWWFVLPWPADLATAASHRETFVSFLLGNQTLGTPKTFAERALDWCAGVFLTPRAFLVGALGALLALRFAAVPALRLVVLVALAFVVPIALHPYHLDRFLVPGAGFLWVLSGIGLASVLPRGGRARAVALALVAAAALLVPALDTAPLGPWVSKPGTPELAEYQRAMIAEKISLAPGRSLPTAGLPRADSEALLDAAAREASGARRIGWLGPPAKLPPAALALGLFARDGDRRRLCEDPARAMILGVDPSAPSQDAASFANACAAFDVILGTDPVVALGTGQWAFVQDWRARLTGELGYVESAGSPFVLHLPLGKERAARLIAWKKSP